MTVWHAVYTITHERTLCGRKWRLEPALRVETLWVRVTCKQCRKRIQREDEERWALEDLLRKKP
jgi:hypothetical protein